MISDSQYKKKTEWNWNGKQINTFLFLWYYNNYGSGVCGIQFFQVPYTCYITFGAIRERDIYFPPTLTSISASSMPTHFVCSWLLLGLTKKKGIGIYYYVDRPYYRICFLFLGLYAIWFFLEVAALVGSAERDTHILFCFWP